MAYRAFRKSWGHVSVSNMMDCKGGCGKSIPESTWKTTCFSCFKATPKGQAWSAAHPKVTSGAPAGSSTDMGHSADLAANLKSLDNAASFAGTTRPFAAQLAIDADQAEITRLATTLDISLQEASDRVMFARAKARLGKWYGTANGAF